MNTFSDDAMFVFEVALAQNRAGSANFADNSRHPSRTASCSTVSSGRRLLSSPSCTPPNPPTTQCLFPVPDRLAMPHSFGEFPWDPSAASCPDTLILVTNNMNPELVSIDIPPEDRALRVVLLELDAPWHSVEPIESVLIALEQVELNLNLGLARMSVDLEDWTAYDRRAAASAVWKGVRKETAITLSSADGRFRSSVSRYDRMPRTGAPVHRLNVTYEYD